MLANANNKGLFVIASIAGIDFALHIPDIIVNRTRMTRSGLVISRYSEYRLTLIQNRSHLSGSPLDLLSGMTALRLKRCDMARNFGVTRR
jgi:hypothetical protein